MEQIIGGSKGGARDGSRRLSYGSNYFIFMQLLGKVDQMIGWCFHLLGWRSLSRKFWKEHSPLTGP